MNWSLTSALDTSSSSETVPSAEGHPEPGRRRGTSGRRMAGKGRRAPTTDVASVRGAPRSSELEMTQLHA